VKSKRGSLPSAAFVFSAHSLDSFSLAAFSASLPAAIAFVKASSLRIESRSVSFSMCAQSQKPSSTARAKALRASSFLPVSARQQA